MLDREVSMRLQTLLIVIGVAVAAGALLIPPGDDSFANPRKARGTITQVSGDGSRFVFSTEDGPARSYPTVAALRWENRRGDVQSSGRPSCVRPGERKPRRAEVSLVDVGDEQKSDPVVVRVRCLD
jgi:hypothetical protein